MPEPTRPVAYLLDLDGTLYAGGTAVPGAPETLERLRREGVPFRLRGYGFAVEPEEVFTATLAGAQRAGLKGWLVRTGKFREETLPDSGIAPDRVLASVAELAPT